MHFLNLTNEEQTEAIEVMSRMELVDIVKLSLAGKVATRAYNQLYADLTYGEETYRWLKAAEGKTVIKHCGPGHGWKYFRKFEADELKTAQECWNQLCFKAENPELPEMIEVEESALQPLEKSNCAPVGSLENVAEQIHKEYRAFSEAEAAATIHAVKLGILIEYVKENLKHGQLLPWIEENCEFSRQHTDRFRNIAKKFLTEQKLKASQLFLGAPMINTIGGATDVVSSQMNEESDQMLFDFIGGRTLPELCEDLNVRWRDAKKKGGDQGGGKARANMSQEEVEEGITKAIRTNWKETAAYLNSDGLDEMTWARLERSEIQGLQALCETLAAKMSKHLNKKGK